MFGEAEGAAGAAKVVALCPALFSMTGGWREVADRNKTEEVTTGE